MGGASGLCLRYIPCFLSYFPCVESSRERGHKIVHYKAKIGVEFKSDIRLQIKMAFMDF